MLHSRGMGDVSLNVDASVDTSGAADGAGGTGSHWHVEWTGLVPHVVLDPPPPVSEGAADSPLATGPATMTSAARSISAFATNPLHIAAARNGSAGYMLPLSKTAQNVTVGAGAAAPVAALTKKVFGFGDLPLSAKAALAAVGAFVGYKIVKRVRKGGLK